MENTLKLGCVVMAAGNSLRFGGNKLTADFNGTPMIRRALQAVPTEQLERTVIVTQYPEIMRLGKEYGFAALYNDRPEDGISRTIALGLTALRDCDGVMFMVADQPLLRRDSVAALAGFWKADPGKIAAVACRGGRGNPCVFPARYFPELLALTGDRGGNAVIARHEEDLALLEIKPEELADVDTREKLESMRKDLR